MKHLILITSVVLLAGCCSSNRQPERTAYYCDYNEPCYGKAYYPQVQMQPQYVPCTYVQGGCGNAMTATESYVDPNTNKVVTVNVNLVKGR